MRSVNNEEKRQRREFDYLCVDDFMKDFSHARALATAFEMGLIDFILQGGSYGPEALAKQWGGGLPAMRLLLSLLLANRVVEDRDGQIRLTGEFLHALQFRDLLELKLQMANFAAHDFLEHFTDMVCRPEQFLGKVRFCRLFDYSRGLQDSRENYEFTKRWMRITTTLTKYEAQACMKFYDFARHRRILDIGGNSGEFVLQICRKYPEVHATVFDLPLVCEVGLDHVRPEPEANRISFVKGSALNDALPEGFDLMIFKSMLHDWPEREAKLFMARAAQALEPGGTLLIFERGPIEGVAGTLPYGTIPMLLFFHSFRSPSLYVRQLEDLGFQEIVTREIDLETPFQLITAVKKPR